MSEGVPVVPRETRRHSPCPPSRSATWRLRGADSGLWWPAGYGHGPSPPL